MKAVDNLKQDHLAVERILNLIDDEWNRVQAGRPVPDGFERWAVESLSHFGDHCHHVKDTSRKRAPCFRYCGFVERRIMPDLSA